MEFIEITSAGPSLSEIYDGILEPSFPPDEMCPVNEVAALASSGQRLVWAAVEDGEIVGTAVGEWDLGPRVVMLAWLAVRQDRRSGGIGGPLFDKALSTWRQLYDPCIILAEVEDPRTHTATEEHGDPAARWRFYKRRGARALDLPYFQASLGPGKNRVPNLLLTVLHADPSFSGEKDDTIRGDKLREYIEIYQTVCEGAVGTDAEAMALYEAIDRPGGVPYLDL